MRRIILISILGFAGVAAMFAQRGGGGHGGGGGFHGSAGGGFHGGAGGFRGTVGFRGNVGFRNNFAFRGNRFFGFSPFFYSGFYGGYPFWDPFFDYSDYGYGYGYPPDYGYASYGGDYGSGAPSVIINQGYAPPPPAAPVIREYTAPAPPPSQAQSNEPPLYLLAFQDGVIRAVLAYWVDGATLHYVSMEHEQKQVPLSSVDRMLSERLNRERNVTFQLPR